MAKDRLEIDYEYDFFLVGISCHEKPYRLCWAINQALELEMELSEPMLNAVKKKEDPVQFTVFSQEDKETDIAFHLMSNKNGASMLIPEQDRIDYFFIVHGPFSDEDHARMLSEIKKIPFVLMSFSINPETLKSKENFLF